MKREPLGHHRLSMPLVLFNPLIGPCQVLPLQATVDLGAMATKGWSALPKAPALVEPYHQIVLCHIPDTRWEWVLLLCREAVGVFYSHSRLGKQKWDRFFLIKDYCFIIFYQNLESNLRKGTRLLFLSGPIGVAKYISGCISCREVKPLT